MHIFTLGELSTLVISAARSVAERGESGGVASKHLPLAVTLRFRNAKEEEGAVPATFIGSLFQHFIAVVMDLLHFSKVMSK